MTRSFGSGTAPALIASLFVAGCGGHVASRQDGDSKATRGTRVAAADDSGVTPFAHSTDSAVNGSLPPMGTAGTTNERTPAGGGVSDARTATTYPSTRIDGAATVTTAAPTDGAPTVTTAAPSAPADLDTYVLARAMAEGRLVATHFRDQQVVVALLDPITAYAKDVGVLHDLEAGPSFPLYDPRTRTAYVAGYDARNATRVYATVLESMASVNGPAPEYYSLGGVAADGRVLGAAWNGVEETLALIDMTVAQTVQIGSLGNLRRWSNQLLFDPATHTAYAMGASDDAFSDFHLYSFALDTRESASVSLGRSYFLGDVAGEGRVIAAYWSGTDERVVLIDAASGIVTEVGVFGDLHLWSGQMAYDPATRVVYAIGQDWNDVAHIYHVDLGG